MKFQKSLITLSLPLLATACGSDSNSNSDPVTPEPSNPSLTLVLPEEGSALVEDFPLSVYLTYPDGERQVDAITSIDINWPKVDIHQAGKEYGFIDGASNELFYHSKQHNGNDALQAIDLERQEGVLWYVSGDGTLSQFSQTNDEKTEWMVHENAEFTELAIDEEGSESIWLYNQFSHQLINYNSNTQEITITYNLDTDLNINGIAISEDNFLILAANEANSIVMQYKVDELMLNHVSSWALEGFGDAQFTDIGLMPDGRVAVSTSTAEENLFLVMDKSELIGAGPIEDAGELNLVNQITLSDDIAQPSGLWSMHDESWMMITDQAEMFALDINFNVIEHVNIEFDSINCNQGCTEAIVGGTDEFFALTDSGLVGQFNKVSGAYSLTQEFQIDVTDEDGNSYSYSGMGKDISSGEYFLIPDQSGEDETDELIILNSDFTLKEKHVITYPEDTDGSIFEYDAQGVQYVDGEIYVLSEQFTKVLKLNLVGEIIEVYDLSNEDVSDPSDLAIRNGQIYILGDHENDEPVPPVSVFEIELN